MSKKRNPNVPAAETKKPDQDIEEVSTISKSTSKPTEEAATPSSAPVSEKPVQEQAPNTQAAAQASISIVALAKGISDDKVAIAESMGIPIKGLMQWALAMENTVVALVKGQQQLGVDLKPLIDAGKQMQTSSNTSFQATGSSNPLGVLGQIGPILQQLGLGGGGAGDSFTELMKQEWIKAGMESMTYTHKIGKAVLDGVSSRLAAEVVTKAVPP